jgi:hypothetical protein
MTSHQCALDVDQPHCFRLARKPHRRLATVPFDNSNVVRCANLDDFISFLIDGPFGGLGPYERFAHHHVERAKQRHPGSVQSYAQCLP